MKVVYLITVSWIYQYVNHYPEVHVSYVINILLLLGMIVDRVKLILYLLGAVIVLQCGNNWDAVIALVDKHSVREHIRMYSMLCQSHIYLQVINLTL